MAELSGTTVQVRGFETVMRLYTGAIFAAIFPVFALLTAFGAIAVSLYRGPQFVRWRAPWQCMSLIHWAAFEWDYNGLGGRQTGARALGLEVSYSGVLR